MPNFISNKGEWYPAKQKVGLVNNTGKAFKYRNKTIQPGEPFIYEGADMGALKMLHEAGQQTLGQDFRHDPEFMQAVRNQGFNSVDEYLKHIDYDEQADEDKFKEQAEVVLKGEMPERVKEVITIGGGKDFSGNKDNDLIGGFGDEKLRPLSEVKK